MFCSKCGTDHSDDSRFCRKCGQALGVVSTGGGAAAAMAPALAPRETRPTSRLRRIPLFVGVLVLIGIIGKFVDDWRMREGLMTNQNSAQSSQPQLHTKSTGNKAFTVSAGGASYVTFEVPAGAYNITLTGHFSATGGLANDIEAFLLTEDDRVNWENGHTVNTLYKSGAVTQETVNLVLANGGKYCFVFNNKISPFTPKAVQANFVWTYYTR